jgi:hypothetical protein
MFVTCFYAILDPESASLRYANAGHDPPYLWRGGDAEQLRARGMPLGLMPGMTYEEGEVPLKVGNCVLFYSDGLVEAHDPEGVDLSRREATRGKLVEASLLIALDLYGYAGARERVYVPAQLPAQGIGGVTLLALLVQRGVVDLRVRGQILPYGSLAFRPAVARQQVCCQRELACRGFLVTVQGSYPSL